MQTITLLFIAAPILVYWIKLGIKYRNWKQEKGIRLFIIQIILVVLFLSVLWWLFIPEMDKKSLSVYFYPKGLLLSLITVITLVVWPIILETRLNKKNIILKEENRSNRDEFS